MQTGRHHVGKHRSGGGVHPFRQNSQVSVGVIDMEKFAKNPVFYIGEFPPPNIWPECIA
jgi:hypothetical protein